MKKSTRHRVAQILKQIQSSDGKIWLRIAHSEELDRDTQMLAQLESEITTRQDYYQICGRW